MIDDKKIEEDAKKYATENPLEYEDQMGDTIDGELELPEAFKEGAHWAIEQFLKDLWHDKTEMPSFKADGSRPIVAELYEGYGKHSYSMFFYVRQPDWRYVVFKNCITRWFYIEDLVKQEGGE